MNIITSNVVPTLTIKSLLCLNCNTNATNIYNMGHQVHAERLRNGNNKARDWIWDKLTEIQKLLAWKHSMKLIFCCCPR